jgi:hypothetical protein
MISEFYWAVTLNVARRIKLNRIGNGTPGNPFRGLGMILLGLENLSSRCRWLSKLDVISRICVLANIVFGNGRIAKGVALW